MTGPKDEKTLDIARRTRKNLEFMYQRKLKGDDVEEFTQLLNSMLSMVISLREDYFRGDIISWQAVEELHLRNWNLKLKITGSEASPQSPNLSQVNSFSHLITRLRNSFAHNCYELIINRKKDLITGVKIWSVPPGKSNKPENRNWEAVLSENELKGLAYLIVEYLEKQLG